MMRRQHKTSQIRLDRVLEHCRRQRIRIQELPREAERVPVEGLGVGKPTELWKLDVEGDSGLGSGGSGCGFGRREDRFLLAERKHCRSRH